MPENTKTGHFPLNHDFFRPAVRVVVDTGEEYVEGGAYLRSVEGENIMMIEQVQVRFNHVHRSIDIKLYLRAGAGKGEKPRLIAFVTTTVPCLVEWGLWPDDGGMKNETDNS